jgi:hypothetical protein
LVCSRLLGLGRSSKLKNHDHKVHARKQEKYEERQRSIGAI